MVKIKDRYKLKLKSRQTMKHFGGRNKLIEKTKNRENIPSLDKVEEVLVQCNLIGNQ